jgi:hypothetical protein
MVSQRLYAQTAEDMCYFKLIPEQEQIEDVERHLKGKEWISKRSTCFAGLGTQLRLSQLPTCVVALRSIAPTAEVLPFLYKLTKDTVRISRNYKGCKCRQIKEEHPNPSKGSPRPPPPSITPSARVTRKTPLRPE